MNKEQFWALFSKGAQGGQQGALQGLEQQAMDARAKQAQASELERLIKSAELKKQADVEGFEREKQYDAEKRTAREAKLDEFIKRFGKGAKVTVSDSGLSYDPESQIMRNAAIDAANQNRVNAGLVQMGKRIEDEKIAPNVEAIKELTDVIGPEGPKSVGGFKNLVPNIAAGLAEKIGILPAGAAEERARLEKMKALTRNPIFGASLTGNEQASADTFLGLPLGADPKEISSTIRRMASIPKSQLANIEATTPEAVRQEYAKSPNALSSQGIESLISGVKQKMAPPGTNSAYADEARKTRLMELRKKYKGY